MHLVNRFFPLLIAAAAVTGCAKPSFNKRYHLNPEWKYHEPGRSALGSREMAVSGNPIASEVGRAIMARGGNAVDAAVAMGFALAVVHPEAGNIGGGGFMVIRLPNDSTFALDFREVAPAAATKDMYADPEDSLTSTVGHLAVGVPGSVAGMFEAHHRFGRLSWKEVLGPAIALARDGFIIDDYRHRSIAADSIRLVRFPASAAQFLPNGAPPAVGTTFKQPELAATLEIISDSGAAGFYRGKVAELIVEEMARGRGLITKADLEDYRVIWREPISFTYRGFTIRSMPPVSSGGVTLALIMNILEGYHQLPGFGTADLLHREAEAMRRAFVERNVSLGDPAFVTNPVERMTSKAHAAERRAEIDLERATPTGAVPTLQEGPSTTHYSVVDSAGMAVSTTTTLNTSYGSAVTVAGGGFLLNNEMDDFTSAPGKPNTFGLIQGEANAIAPKKRMLSAMSPTIVLDPAGRLFMVLGTPGGPTIITQVYHILSNVIDHRMDLPTAVALPRMHHQALPDQITVEQDGFRDETIRHLESMGHKVAYRSYMGDVEAIIRTDSGWLGVSDPRRGGGAAGR